MAFRASELRLILGIQAYGTTNLARLRRDITSLGRAADVANANQMRVQDQIVAKRAQVAASTQKIASMENRLAQNRVLVEAQAAAQAERFATRRSMLAQRELQATEALANRRIQIGRMEDRIGAMKGSGMQGFAVQDAQLAQRRLGFQNQLNTLSRQGIGLEAQGLRNRAAQIRALQRLEAFTGGGRQMENVLKMQKTFENAAPHIQAQALQYKALLKDAEKIAAANAHLPAQVAAVNQQLAVAVEQEKLISARKFEQAAAIGRAEEALIAQRATLSTIEERLVAINAEEKAIAASESMTNAQRTRSLALLDDQVVALNIEKVKVGELIAEYETLSTVQLQRARAADEAAARAGRAQQLEVAGRTIAHIGRTAQFAGLITTAAFTAASASFADFNRGAALAGTQMRDVAAPMAQAAVRGKQLEDQILRLMQVFPATAQEMSDSAYEIFSSMNLAEGGVVNVAKGYRLMAVANKVAVAGQVDLDEATKAMIVTLNNFDPNLEHIGQTMNQVFAITRFGQLRISDFAAAMTPLAPIAKTFGLSLNDVGSALATLSIVFKSPQQGAQGLARAIELLNLDPFTQGLEKFGVKVRDTTGRMRPFSAIIEDLAKQFPEAATSQKGIVNVLTDISKASGLTKAGIQGTVQARRALGALITSMGLYRNIINNVTNDQGEFNKSYQALNRTPGVQWQLFVNQMRAFALVIGRAALPVMLRVGDWLIKAAHWIERLVKNTDGAIVKWAAFAGVAILVGGTLLNVAGSLTALVANLKIATISMATLEGQATTAGRAAGILGSTLTVLAGIGIISIPIVMQVIKGGDPSLWDFLGGALSGAAGGAMIGGAVGGPIGAAAGAGIGAITVPIVMNVISHFQAPNPADMEPVKAAYQNFMRDALKPGGQPISFDEFKKQFDANINKFKIPRIGEDIAREGKKPLSEADKLMKQYQDYLKASNQDWLKAQKNYINALTGGDSGKGKADEAVRLAKERARIHAQAWKQMQEEIQQTVDKLGQTYDQFLDQNKQAFGELFQGPALSGFLGDIFRGINDTLMQFGQSVPVPIQLINKDLEMQIANFDKLREGYAALLKRGIPQEVVQEIQKMGIAGLPFVQGLVNASGPEFNRFVKNVKTKQKELEKYTKIDFTNQLNQWKKYGSDIATKMIDGLSSEAAQAELKMGFDKYVMQLFGKTLTENMNKTIQAGLAALDETKTAGDKATKGQDKISKQAVAAAKRAREAARDKTTDKAAANADKAAARRTAPQVTLPSIAAVSGGFVPGRASGITTIHTGDQVTIHADGVHPKRVSQVINKNSFERRNRKR